MSNVYSMKKTPYAKIVKDELGSPSVEALTSLFKNTVGTPPSVQVDRFRADNSNWFDILDELEHGKSLIERSRDGADYILRSYALLLIEDKTAERLLGLMQDIYLRLQYLYPKHLSESLSLEILLDGINADKNEMLDALYYLSEAHHVWSGKSIGFPYAKNSSMAISESVLRHKGIEEVLAQYYEWHFISPKNKSTNLVDSINEDSLGKNQENISLIDTVNIKPGFFGISVDIKKLFSFFYSKK